MAYLNRVQLIGNLGKDPEIRVTQNGQKQAKLTLATTEHYKDKVTGEARDKTQWHNLIAWRVMAEQIERLQIRKGTSIYIEGKLTYRSWDDDQGQKKYMTEIEVQSFQILTPRDRNAQGSRDSASPSSSAPTYDSAPTSENDSFDDMPF